MGKPISSEDWARVEALFDEVMSQPPHERAGVLEERSADDAWLRAEVSSLVDFARTEIGTALEDIVAKAARQAGVLGTGALGTRVGPYRLEAELGRGGMGVVYLGVREDADFAQRVAIKLLPGALYSDEMTWRFSNERRILASLEHPGVARFLDGGATPEGVPYAVMEYVDGEPIDAYCKRRDLGIDERLDLFVRVCEAVRYAHGQLVVHRDIKPANILVDAAGMPRLLDFGIAKLVEPGADGAERTVTRIMTPHFASPEQVSGQPATAATDVYALGALLYVLLSGRRPHEDAATTTELARRVVETDPPPPSAASGDRRLAGDLDTIVLTAMRREPAERYATVDRLIQDVAAYRASLPISAAPPSWAYRTRKFVTRNRGVVAAGAIAALAVLAGGVATAVGMVRARTAETGAEEEARVASEVSDFLVSLFGKADPDNSLGKDPTAHDLLDAGVDQIDQQLSGQPAVQARLKETMARSYENLGDLQQAEHLYLAALELSTTDAQRAKLREALGAVYRQSFRYDDALASLAEAIEIAEPLVDTTNVASLRSTRDLSGVLASALQERGVVLMTTHDSAQSISSLERAVRLRERLEGPDSESTATAVAALAASYGTFGRLLESQAAYERAIAIYERTLDPRHPSLLIAYDGLAVNYARREVFDSASKIFERLLPLERDVWGPMHPRVSQTLTNLGAMNSALRNDSVAERYIREAIAIDSTRLGPDNDGITVSLNNLALIRQRQGDYVGAEQLWQRATDIRRQALGRDNPRTISTLLGVANMRRLQERWQSSADAYGEAVVVLRRSGPVSADVLRDYASVLRKLGREADAREIDEELATRPAGSAGR
jgi:eukaryotic-like serine/threonine-protein kinase